MRRKLILAGLLCLYFTAQPAYADFIGTANKGTEAYRAQDYKSALELYRTAEADNPTSPELDYNIATVLHQEGGFEEAIKKYEQSLRTELVPLEAAAHYNMGNTYYRMGDYQNAIKAYQEALELNPDDMDAKFNLELARKMLKEQIKPQNQQNDQQDQQQQNQDQNQQNQDEQSQDQQDQQQQQNQQDQQNQDQQEQQQQTQPQDKPMSKEDAERILNALKDDEQDLQKKVRRETVRGEYSGKDW